MHTIHNASDKKGPHAGNVYFEESISTTACTNYQPCLLV